MAVAITVELRFRPGRGGPSRDDPSRDDLCVAILGGQAQGSESETVTCVQVGASVEQDGDGLDASSGSSLMQGVPAARAITAKARIKTVKTFIGGQSSFRLAAMAMNPPMMATMPAPWIQRAR